MPQKDGADAKARSRQQIVSQTILVVRDPEAAVVARLKALQLAYPETEITIRSCEYAASRLYATIAKMSVVSRLPGDPSRRVS